MTERSKNLKLPVVRTKNLYDGPYVWGDSTPFRGYEPEARTWRHATSRQEARRRHQGIKEVFPNLYKEEVK